MAKFHAVSLTYKQALFSTFSAQSAQAKASRQIDEVVMEGDNKVLTGRQGLFARFPFLAQRVGTLAYLVDNRAAFLDMFHKFLRCFPEEEHLVDIFEYLRLSVDDILLLSEDPCGDEYVDSPLDAISLGVLETRSFLFRYDDGDGDKENDGLGGGGGGSGGGPGGKKKKASKLQRSQSERVKDRTRFAREHGFGLGGGCSPTSPIPPPSPNVRIPGMATPQRRHSPPEGGGASSPGASAKHPKTKGAAGHMPASPKCPKLDTLTLPMGGGGGGGAGMGDPKRNKFFQNVIGKSKDDEKVQITTRRASRAQKDRDPNQAPKTAAVVNAKFVTYGRVTRDLAVLFWTAAPTLVRRFYLVKMVECYAETLGIALGQLGVDTDSFGLKYQAIVEDFQKHLLYGFVVAVLIDMASTSPEELDAFYASRRLGKQFQQHQNGGFGAKQQQQQQQGGSPFLQQQPQQPESSRFIPLTEERVSHLRDLMRDVGCYIESKDFEQGLPVTNFERYHELWSMEEDDEDEEGEACSEDSDEDEEEEEEQYESAEEN